jgi:light-regulated signal transduction histidine kinase (bacteriophytochrome)
VRAELVGRLTATGDIGGVLASADLLRYLGAGGAAVYVEGELHLAGETPGSAQIPALVAWLNQVNRPLFATDRLASHYPPAATFAATASGLLAVGLSREPRDYVLWFRPEIGRTVRWAGDPSKPLKVDRHGARLTPRGSFAEWLEVTRMQSAAWSPVDLEAAEALRVVFLESVLKSMDLARAEDLEKRVAQRTSQLRALAVELEAAEDRERRQIARDLHDDLGQTLAAARIRLAALCGDERTDVRSTALGVGELIDRANDAIRSLAAQLAPDVLHELGISPALEWLGEEVERTFGLRVIVRDDGRPKPLTQDMRSILYRAVRELLINVAKHARTHAATIDAYHQDGRLVVSVRDEGAGFDVAAVLGGSRRGSGIVSVRERLALLEGSLEIRSAPGAGTTAVVSLPLTDEFPHAAAGGGA